jgi:antirestriction protein ArdC
VAILRINWKSILILEGKRRLNMGNKVYEIMLDKVIKKLETGTIPWEKPWIGGAANIPQKLVSGQPYRGINVFWLGMQGYANPYWASWNQIKKMKGEVKEDQRKNYSISVFWKLSKFDVENDDGTVETKTSRILRYYNIYNVEQTEGLTTKRVLAFQNQQAEKTDAREFNPIMECEAVVNNMPNPPSIANGVQRAYYRPSNDSVNMPAKNSFRSDEEYYSTLFHELTHSTGHESRLGRHKYTPHHISKVDYSKEELVAEMGATFLAGLTGIEKKTIDNSAAYIKGWLKALKDDPKMVVQAGAAAQKAVDHIKGISWDN